MRLFLLVALAACDPSAGDDKVQDVDSDGLFADEDCDDSDASIGVAYTFNLDQDGDGFAGSETTTACFAPENASDILGDCDDTDLLVHPAGTETCDGKDNDCDESVDEDLTNVYFADTDGDGFGDDQTPLSACEQPDGYVANATDCDDELSTKYPNAPELCNQEDDDCDEVVDNNATGTQTWYADEDGDGFGEVWDSIESCLDPGNRVLNPDDCDDSRGAVNPDAAEVCNSIDDDCDGQTDESDATDATEWYFDADSDAYGTADASVLACEQPAGYVEYSGDCNDANAAYNPAAAEPDCDDPNDYNCDGSVGYLDADGDLWAACAECDDTNAAIHPAATEVCDGADNDCDGTIDEPDAAGAAVWYADADTDTFGNPATGTLACDAPAGFVADASDCDDGTATTRPGATEYCNGADDNCDGTIDENTAADATTWYADGDGDSYGDPADSLTACDAPSGFIADMTDCNDGRNTIHPGATEYCNTQDDDCDGVIDEDAVDSQSYWPDSDADGYGNPALPTEACSAPAGHVRDDDDCDDNDGTIHPAATEVCDGLDNNCDTIIDDTSTLFDFDSGISSADMVLNDDANISYSGTNGYLALTNLGTFSGGTAWLVDDIDAADFTVSFSFYIHGGSGADGFSFAWVTETSRNSIGALGGYLALSGLHGYAVEFDTFTNDWESSENHVAIINPTTFATYVQSNTIPELEDTGWHDATVLLNAGTVQVYVDGAQYINYAIPGYALTYAMAGFTSASGSLTNYHDIDDVDLSCP